MDTGQNGYVDLHTHTTCSDGLLTPTELVEQARSIPLRALGITDHDSVQGIEEARRAADGLEVISGVELSASEGPSEIHILGYYVDPAHDELLSYLHLFRTERRQRAHRIVARLNDLGVPLAYEDVRRFVDADEGSIGRPHVAQALVEGGYVASIAEAFHRYLGSHAPACIPKHKIMAWEAIRLIRAAGGLAVLAHPGSVRRDELIPSLVDAGLGGIETIHPEHTATDQRYYTQLARKHRLVVTGGTDYHGPRPDRPALGSLHIPYACVAAMRQRVNGQDRAD